MQVEEDRYHLPSPTTIHRPDLVLSVTSSYAVRHCVRLLQCRVHRPPRTHPAPSPPRKSISSASTWPPTTTPSALPSPPWPRSCSAPASASANPSPSSGTKSTSKP